MMIFDRRAVRLHRDRAASSFEAHDFLLREVAERLVDRLDDIKRRFPVALDIGCHRGELGRVLHGRGGVGTLVHCDLSERMVERVPAPALVADEEMLPFAPGAFDLALSVLSLHWVNDLPGTLAQIRTVLKPDGLFLAAMFGGHTLHELRHALSSAELAVEGGHSPRISPFADVRDAGSLLQRAGFALPVVDTDSLTVSYPHPLKLMRDLRGMGETNAVIERRRGISRKATLFEAVGCYERTFGDDAGRVPATFQVVYFTGWAPHASQQEPLRRGSATSSLVEALSDPESPRADDCSTE